MVPAFTVKVQPSSNVKLSSSVRDRFTIRLFKFPPYKKVDRSIHFIAQLYYPFSIIYNRKLAPKKAPVTVNFCSR